MVNSFFSVCAGEGLTTGWFLTLLVHGGERFARALSLIQLASCERSDVDQHLHDHKRQRLTRLPARLGSDCRSQYCTQQLGEDIHYIDVHERCSGTALTSLSEPTDRSLMAGLLAAGGPGGGAA